MTGFSRVLGFFYAFFNEFSVFFKRGMHSYGRSRIARKIAAVFSLFMRLASPLHWIRVGSDHYGGAAISILHS